MFCILWRYLTDHTTPEEIELAKKSGIVYACKYYPAGATTNSDNGVTDIHNVYSVLVVILSFFKK